MANATKRLYGKGGLSEPGSFVNANKKKNHLRYRPTNITSEMFQAGDLKILNPKKVGTGKHIGGRKKSQCRKRDTPGGAATGVRNPTYRKAGIVVGRHKEHNQTPNQWANPATNGDSGHLLRSTPTDN